LQEACAELEVKHGLIRDNHTPERGKTEKARGRAADFEAFQGYPSFLQWVRQNAGPALLGAREGGKGWQGLHRVASAYDLEIKPRGAGLVIGDRSGRLHVRASEVDRVLSIKALTDIFGPYEPPDERARTEQLQTRYARPERTGPLYEAFNRERDAALAAREAAAKALREQHLAYRRQLREWYRQRFRQEKLSGFSGVLRRQSFQHLITEQKQDRARRIAQEAEERRQLRARHPIPSWQGYLEVEAARGNAAALATLRRRMRRRDRSRSSSSKQRRMPRFVT